MEIDINGNVSVTAASAGLSLKNTDNGDSTNFGDLQNQAETTPSKTFPVIKRPSGLISRQNSGINAILDTDLMLNHIPANSPPHHPHLLPNSPQIRTSYDQPMTTTKGRAQTAPPLRLTNILQHRMQKDLPTQKSRKILNKEFFESIQEDVRTMSKNRSSEGVAAPEEKQEVQPPSSKPEGDGFVGNNSDLSKAQNSEQSYIPPNQKTLNPKDSGNLNINFTVQLGQVGGKPVADLDLRELCQNRISVIDARNSNPKVESSIQTDTLDVLNVDMCEKLTVSLSQGKLTKQKKPLKSCLKHSNAQKSWEPRFYAPQPQKEVPVLPEIKESPERTENDFKSRTSLTAGVNSIVSYEFMPMNDFDLLDLEAVKNCDKTPSNVHARGLNYLQFSEADNAKIEEWAKYVLRTDCAVAQLQEEPPIVEQPTPEEPVPEKPVTEEPTPEEPKPEEPKPEEPKPEEPKPEEPKPEEREVPTDDILTQETPEEAKEPVAEEECIITDLTEAETDINGNPEEVTTVCLNELETTDESGIIMSSIGKVFEFTGDSISTTFSLLANIVPVDNEAPDEALLDESEDDLPIKMMSFMGVPKDMRHNIYNEACGEMEVLTELGTGTYDVLTTILKWVCGGKRGRQDFVNKARTLCSVHSEVDYDSGIWCNAEEEVVEFGDAVGDAVDHGVTTVEDTIGIATVVKAVKSATAVVKKIKSITSQMSTSSKKKSTSSLKQISSKGSMTNDFCPLNMNSATSFTNPGARLSMDNLVTMSTIPSTTSLQEALDHNAVIKSGLEELSKSLISRTSVAKMADNSSHPVEVNAEDSATPSSTKFNPAVPFIVASEFPNYKINPEAFREQLKNPNAAAAFNSLATNLASALNGNNNVVGYDFRKFLAELYSAQTTEVQAAEGQLENSAGSGNNEVVEEIVKKEKDFENVPDENNNIVEAQATVSKELPPVYSYIINTQVDDGTQGRQPQEGSSSLLLAKLPQPPHNSETTMAPPKHEEKIIEDLSKLENLVHELVEDLVPVEADPKPDIPQDVVHSPKKSSPGAIPCRIPKLKHRTPTPTKDIEALQASEEKSTKLKRGTSESTVSLYHSSRSSASERSMTHSNPFETKEKRSMDQNNNEIMDLLRMEMNSPLGSISAIDKGLNNNKDDDTVSTTATQGSNSNHSFTKPTISTINKCRGKNSSTAVTRSSTRFSTLPSTPMTISNSSWVNENISDSSVECPIIKKEIIKLQPQVQKSVYSTYQQMYKKSNLTMKLGKKNSSTSMSSSSTHTKPKSFRF